MLPRNLALGNIFQVQDFRDISQPKQLLAANLQLLPTCFHMDMVHFKQEHVPGGTSSIVSGLGPSFECEVVGHLRKNCPKLLIASAANSGTVNK